MRLELLSEARLPDVDALVADPEILHHTLFPEPPPPDFARRMYERYEQRRADGTGEIWAALDDDDTFLGLGMAPVIEPEERQLELGYMVGPNARGRGVATEMLRQLTRWALDEAGALRIVLIINAGNPASIRVAEKAGYVREGVMRSVYMKQGRRSDAAIYSLLPSDPRP